MLLKSMFTKISQIQKHTCYSIPLNEIQKWAKLICDIRG